MYKKYIKRILDIILSILLLIILFPLFIIIAIAIKLGDRKSIIYKQERTGKENKKFEIYKFRTMNEKEPTKIGKVLRKTGLDELPQLINILKGEMSLIGPRPWIPEYYKHFSKSQKKRVTVRPGLIGLAQLKSNKIDVLKKIEYDLEYIENISFTMDIKIIVKSIKMIIKNKHNEITQEEITREIQQLQMH